MTNIYRQGIVRKIIADAGAEFRSMLQQRSISVEVRRMDAERFQISKPPYVTKGSIGRVDLSPLGEAFHRDDTTLQVLMGVFPKVYSDLLGLDLGSSKVTISSLERAYPGNSLPRSPRDHEMQPLIYLTYATGWQGAEVEVTDRSIRARYGSDFDVEIGQNHFRVNGSLRRLREPLRLSPRDILEASAGKPRVVINRLGAVYRVLLSHLPELTKEINTLVAAAQHSGFIDDFITHFDVDYRKAAAAAADPHKGSWHLGLRLITGADAMPWRALKTALTGLVAARQFNEAFGTEGQWAGRRYTESMRLRHVTSLVNMQTPQGKVSPPTTQDHIDMANATNLFNMQEQLR
jgi:hypothetical protein